MPLENWINDKLKKYLENNLETILSNISDETICKYFDKAKDFVIETRNLRKDYAVLKAENEMLKIRLGSYKS